MADHTDPVAMVRESLPEYVKLARLGLGHVKDGVGSVLGYASAEILFRIVDVMGGYCVDEEVAVRDGQRRRVGTESQGFFVLNHPYFGYEFSAAEIARICKQTRNPLTHSALLGAGVRFSTTRA